MASSCHRDKFTGGIYFGYSDFYHRRLPGLGRKRGAHYQFIGPGDRLIESWTRAIASWNGSELLAVMSRSPSAPRTRSQRPGPTPGGVAWTWLLFAFYLFS